MNAFGYTKPFRTGVPRRRDAGCTDGGPTTSLSCGGNRGPDRGKNPSKVIWGHPSTLRGLRAWGVGTRGEAPRPTPPAEPAELGCPPARRPAPSVAGRGPPLCTPSPRRHAVPGEAERGAPKPETWPPQGASGRQQHRSAGGKVTRGSREEGRSSRQGRRVCTLGEDALAAGAAEHTSWRDALAAPRASSLSLPEITHKATGRACADPRWRAGRGLEFG